MKSSAIPTSFLVGSGCVTTAGGGKSALWNALLEGRDLSGPVSTAHWPVPAQFQPYAYLIPEGILPRHLSSKEFQVRGLLRAWREAREEAHGFREHLSLHPERTGILFASTKGNIEDWVWDSKIDAQKASDPYSPILDTFIDQAELTAIPSLQRMTVSNACTSTLGAISLAQRWIAQGRIDQAIILSSDQVGPFTLQGFQSLRALTETGVRPFAKDRSGLRVGEAATVLLISKNPENGTLTLGPVAIDAEGYSATRPRETGDSLLRAIRVALKERPTIDLVIAHGTGTHANDLIEDRVLSTLFKKEIPITATKWAVGHTLGASASIDLIAAHMIIQHQKFFRIASTEVVDTDFQGKYLTRATELPAQELRSILVSSLGFGGVHSAVRVGQPTRERTSK